MKPTPHTHYLVIDQGGHSTRALVFDTQGEVILSVHAGIETQHPKPGWFEQDANQLALSVASCLEQLESQLARRSLVITAAAVITQRSSLLACERNTLHALTPVISWQDTRHADWLQQEICTGHLDVAKLKSLTGLRLNAHYGASKIRWLLDNDANVQKAAREHNLVFLPLAAYVTHLLTSNKTIRVDAVSASRTFLTTAGKCQWSPVLLELFHIGQDVLPHIVSSRDTFGDIPVGPHRIPLRVLGGDQSFVPFAYGTAISFDTLFVNAGTGAFVQTPLSLQDTPAALLNSMAATDARQTVMLAEGTVNACATALDWLWQQEQVCLSSEAMEQALESCEDPPLFYHRITALGSPYWLPEGISSFSREASLEEKAVAVIESVVFLLAINIALLQGAKTELRQILISGGMAASDGFCRKLADCAGLKVIRHRDHEASARGAAFYLADIRQYQPGKLPATFTPGREPALQQRYQQFCEWLHRESFRAAG